MISVIGLGLFERGSYVSGHIDQSASLLRADVAFVAVDGLTACLRNAASP